MCHYASFLIDKRGRLYFGRLDSHSGIEAGHGLKPGSYREAEWTGEGPDSLTVRVEEGEDPNWYRAMILAEYPTRSDLLSGAIVGRADDTVYHYFDGQLHREDGPAIECVNGHKEWYWADQRHREDGPAVERADGTKIWYWADQLHREDGPAVELVNGDKEWWLNGQRQIGG